MAPWDFARGCVCHPRNVALSTVVPAVLKSAFNGKWRSFARRSRISHMRAAMAMMPISAYAHCLGADGEESLGGNCSSPFSGQI